MKNDLPKTKVFCVGFQKTGTSSLRDALKQMGYSVKGIFGGESSLDELRENYVQLGLKLAAKYDAVEDMPWPILYRELDQHFPNSKFILSERDVDRWLLSVVTHFGEKVTTRRQLVYGEDAGCPVGNEARYREVFLAHNAEVKAYFADRPDDLLIFNLEQGDGWAQLGAFLGLKNVPDGPFVHANKADYRATWQYQILRQIGRVRHKLGMIN